MINKKCKFLILKLAWGSRKYNLNVNSFGRNKLYHITMFFDIHPNLLTIKIKNCTISRIWLFFEVKNLNFDELGAAEDVMLQQNNFNRVFSHEVMSF